MLEQTRERVGRGRGQGHATTLTVLTMRREWVMLVYGRARPHLRLEHPGRGVRLVEGPVRPERRNAPGRAPVAVGPGSLPRGQTPPPASHGGSGDRGGRH